MQEYDQAFQKSGTPGTICIVVGGNTWALASAFAPLPGLRQQLSKRVEDGELMYISFSAGSIFAGESIRLATDSQDGVKKFVNDGLNLCRIDGDRLDEFAIRPHAEQPWSQRAGKDFVALVEQGAIVDEHDAPVVCSVKYIEDGEAGLVLGHRWYILPRDQHQLPLV